MENKIKVAIIGLGLIGASILKALHKNGRYELTAVSKSSYKKALKYTKNAFYDVEYIKEADIIFICLEFDRTLKTLDKLNTFIDKKTIVADVASIKSALLNKKYNFNFILTHPMAGSHKRGFESADIELFKGAKWLIEKENKILKTIIKDLGAIPLKIDMKDHDKMCANISHLPAILSFLLFNCADNSSKQIASSGFRDFTRLAMTGSDLALSMIKENEENITNAFNNLISEFERLKKLSDNEKIKLFDEISEKRAKMYDKNGKNIFKI